MRYEHSIRLSWCFLFNLHSLCVSRRPQEKKGAWPIHKITWSEPCDDSSQWGIVFVPPPSSHPATLLALRKCTCHFWQIVEQTVRQWHFFSIREKKESFARRGVCVYVYVGGGISYHIYPSIDPSTYMHMPKSKPTNQPQSRPSKYSNNNNKYPSFARVYVCLYTDMVNTV